jgi:hypothetical protein
VVAKKTVVKTQPKKTVVKKTPVKKAAPKPAPKKTVVQAKMVKKPVSAEEQEVIKKKICDVWGDKCKEALIIAKHESGFNPYSVSGTGDHGVFQLNCRWQGRRVGGDCTKFHDIDTNIRVAKQIYDEQNWRPWSTKGFIKKEMAL